MNSVCAPCLLLTCLYLNEDCGCLKYDIMWFRVWLLSVRRTSPFRTESLYSALILQILPKRRQPHKNEGTIMKQNITVFAFGSVRTSKLICEHAVGVFFCIRNAVGVFFCRHESILLFHLFCCCMQSGAKLGPEEWRLLGCYSVSLLYEPTWVTRIGEVGTTLAVTSNRNMLRRATQRNIPEDGILHTHRCGNLKSYTKHFGNWMCFRRSGGGGRYDWLSVTERCSDWVWLRQRRYLLHFTCRRKQIQYRRRVF
jgi:hypothetical protein